MATERKFDNGYALVVGVGCYKSQGIEDVPETANEAEEIARLLADLEFCAYPEDQVVLLTNEHATKGKILVELDKLCGKVAEGVQATVVLYFAGHGAREKGEYFFLPHNSEVEVDHQGKLITPINEEIDISHEEFLSAFNKLHFASWVKRLVLIFNTCQSGSLLGKRLSPSAANSTYFQAVPAAVYEQLLSGEGTCFIGACKANQVSVILDNARYSVFGEKLIAALRGEASSSYNNKLMLRDITYYLAEEVKRETENKQKVSIDLRRSDPDFPVALLRGGHGDAIMNLQMFMSRALELDDQRHVAALARVEQADVAEGDRHTLPLRLIDNYYGRQKMAELEGILRSVKPEAANAFFSQHDIPSLGEQISGHAKELEAKRRESTIAQVKDEYFGSSSERAGVDMNALTKKSRQALLVLDREGKNELLAFLQEIGVLGSEKGVNISRTNLSGVNMCGFDLSTIDLSKTNLSRASLSNCNLSYANLSGANLTEADLEKADLQKANCRDTDLCKAILNDANLLEADFTKAKLQKSSFCGRKTNLERTILEKAELQGVNFDQARISFIKLRDCIFDEDTVIDSKWRMVRDLQTRQASTIDLEDRKINDADLRKTDLRDVAFSGLILDNVDFSDTDLRGAFFKDSILIDCKFVGAKLMQSNVFRQIGDRLNRWWTGLTKSALYSPDQEWGIEKTADFSGAILLGVCFEDAYVSDEMLSSALGMIDVVSARGEKQDNTHGQIIRDPEQLPDAPYFLSFVGEDAECLSDDCERPSLAWILNSFDFKDRGRMGMGLNDVDRHQVDFTGLGVKIVEWSYKQELEPPAHIIESLDQFRKRLGSRVQPDYD